MDENNSGSKFFESLHQQNPKKILIKKNLDQKNFGSKKLLVHKISGPKKFRPAKLRAPSQIFLIWTNVARIDVAWTNVPVTVSICERWSQESTLKVWSKVSNSYSLYGQMSPGQMLHDKCHCDSWHPLKMVLGAYL